jgi:hypothetical protein
MAPVALQRKHVILYIIIIILICVLLVDPYMCVTGRKRGSLNDSWTALDQPLLYRNK